MFGVAFVESGGMRVPCACVVCVLHCSARVRECVSADWAGLAWPGLALPCRLRGGLRTWSPFPRVMCRE